VRGTATAPHIVHNGLPRAVTMRGQCGRGPVVNRGRRATANSLRCNVLRRICVPVASARVAAASSMLMHVTGATPQVA
jgi:hypothetical protein